MNFFPLYDNFLRTREIQQRTKLPSLQREADIISLKRPPGTLIAVMRRVHIVRETRDVSYNGGLQWERISF